MKLKEDEGEDFSTNFFKEMQTPATIDTVGGQVEEVTASYAGGKVTLETKTPNAEIYYTVDGTEPTVESASLYSLPFEASVNNEIKAIAVKGNYSQSETLIYQVV